MPSLEERSCSRHGKSVPPARWRNGHRTGCIVCLKIYWEKNKVVPPPEERMCLRHNKPICPGSWIKGCRHSECANCVRERRCSPKAKARRAQRWDSVFVVCVNHPNKQCNRSFYVRGGGRRCLSCRSRYPDGSYRAAVIRNGRKKSYSRVIKRRFHSPGNGNTLRGLELFERSTGFSYGGNQND